MPKANLNVNLTLSLIIAASYGVLPILQKMLLNDLPVEVSFALGAPIYTSAMAAFVFYNWQRIHPHLHKITGRHLALVIGSSLVCSFFTNLLLLRVMRQNDSFIVTAVTCSSPVFTAVLGYLVLKEKITLVSGVGVALVTAGVILLSSGIK